MLGFIDSLVTLTLFFSIADMSPKTAERITNIADVTGNIAERTTKTTDITSY